MIEQTPSVPLDAATLKKWGITVFDLQRELTGGYGELPSDTEAGRIVEEAEKLAQEIMNSGTPVTGSLKNDLSHFFNTVKERGLDDAAPTLKQLAGD